MFLLKHTGVQHSIFITYGLNRHQSLIQSVDGFKKPIYSYTNQGHIN